MIRIDGKKKVLAIAIVVLSIIMISGCNLVQKNPEAIKKQVVAKVGDQEITWQEFNYYLTIEKLNWKVQGQEFPTDDDTLGPLKEQILDVIIENNLLLQSAKSENIEIQDVDVDDQVENTINSIKEDFGGEEDYRAFLEENWITPEEFQDFLKNYLIGNEYIVGLYEKLTEDIKVSDEEVSKYYQENIKQFDPSTVEAKHILAETKEQAEEVEKKAKNGEDFDALMEEYRDKEGIREAADLGEFTFTRMVPEFSEAAFALEPGDISDVVETANGFHVIKVEDKNMEEVQKLDEVKDSIKAQLESNAAQEAFLEHYNQLKEKIEVKAYPKKL